jgi:hypothetical protein
MAVTLAEQVVGLVRFNRNQDNVIVVTALLTKPVPAGKAAFANFTFVADETSDNVVIKVKVVELSSTTGAALVSNTDAPGASLFFDVSADRRRRFTFTSDYLSLAHRMRRASLGDDSTNWDFNGDGVVTVGDALLLLQYTTGELGQAPGSLAAMDADLNGEVSLNDVVFVLDALAGRVRRVVTVQAVGVQDLQSDCFIRVAVTIDSSVGGSTAAAVQASTQLYSGLVTDDSSGLNELYTTFGITGSDIIAHGGFAALADVSVDGSRLTYTARHISTYLGGVLAVNPWQFVGPENQPPVSDFFHTGSLSASLPTYQAFDSTVRDGQGSAFLPSNYTGVISFSSTQTTDVCRSERAPEIIPLTKVPTNGSQVSLTIKAPVEADALNISQYIVQWRIIDCGDPRLRVSCSEEPFNIYGAVSSQQLATGTVGSPITVSGLQPFIRYEFRVVLEVAAGSSTRLSVASNPAEVQTAQDEPEEAPSNVSVHSPMSTSLSITYTQIPLPQTNGQPSYFVRASRVSGQPKANPADSDIVTRSMHEQENNAASTLTFELTGLESNINYKFEVYAVNSEDGTVLSSSVVDVGTFKTGPSPPEEAPELPIDAASDITNTTMRITWVEPIKHTHNVDTLLYHVAYRQADTTTYSDGTNVEASNFVDYNNASFKLIESLTTVDVVLADLHPGVDYIVKVKAYGIQDGTRYDDNEFSVERVFRTAEAGTSLLVARCCLQQHLTPLFLCSSKCRPQQRPAACCFCYQSCAAMAIAS